MTPEERLRQMMAGARGDDAVTDSQWEGFADSARRSLRIQRMVAGGVALLVLAAAIVGGAALFGDFGSGDAKIAPANPSTTDGCQDIDAPWDPNACNYDPDAPPSPTSMPSEMDAKPPPDLVETEIWLVDPSDDTLSWGTRLVPGGDSLERALEELLRGPIASDDEIGITTEIPEGTELLSVEILDGVAHIDVSSEFNGDEFGKGTLQLREAQLVFTATQIEGVDAVRVFVEGEPYLDQVNPGGRDDYDDVAPPIVVELPKIGDELTSPLTVSGTANVFEATVSIRLRIGSGKDEKVIETFATATCGSGCRGEFSEDISFEVTERTEARLDLYESSAEDGSELHGISLPITLLPN